MLNLLAFSILLAIAINHQWDELSFLALTGLQYLVPKQRIFCPSNPTLDCLTGCPNPDDCIPCPEHGICSSQGELKCAEGYLREGATCVENLAVATAARDSLKQIEAILMAQKGAHVCGWNVTAGEAYRDVAFFLEQLNKKAISREKFSFPELL